MAVGPRRGTAWGVLAGVLAVASVGAGCRDMTFSTDRGVKRPGEQHILAGRARGEGGPWLTDEELRSGRFVSRSEYLDPLERTLNTRLGGQLDVFADLEVAAEGDITRFNPAISERGRVESNPETLDEPFDTFAVDRINAQYETLCEHPILGGVFPKFGETNPCTPIDLSFAGFLRWDSADDVFQRLRIRMHPTEDIDVVSGALVVIHPVAGL